MMAAFLGSDQAQDLAFRIQLHSVSVPVPSGNFPAEGQHAFFFVDRILVVDGILGPAAELVNDALRRGIHGIAHSQVDDVHSLSPRFVDFVPQGNKEIGRNLLQTVGSLHTLLLANFELTVLLAQPQRGVQE